MLSIELMKVHVEALFTQNENGCLKGINEPDGDAMLAPRFFFGHTNEGSICRFRYDLPEYMVMQLKEVVATEPMVMGQRTISQFHDIRQSHAG